MDADYEIVPFIDFTSFRAWIDKHHVDTNGIWVRMYKKATGTPSIDYAGALDVALCYGWIDGVRKSYDEVSFVQKFTPRRAKSMWSKRNVEYIARLTEAGLMMPAGVAEVDRAKADGRWDAAYDRASTMTIPDYFMTELHRHPVAEAFFGTLNKTSRFMIGFQLQTAKTDETRQRRTNKLIDMLEAGQKP